MDNSEKLATYGTPDEHKQNKHTTQYGDHYAQASTNNVNKTWALLQTTGSKDEPKYTLMQWKTDMYNSTTEL
jgi:hypothetical protein